MMKSCNRSMRFVAGFAALCILEMNPGEGVDEFQVGDRVACGGAEWPGSVKAA
jgi:NADPH:quinone reductase-like Zn-dependent oxidoreductase